MAAGDIRFSQKTNEVCEIEQADGTYQRAVYVASVSDVADNNYLNVGQDFYLRVQQGLVPGHSSVGKYGVNQELTPSTDPEDMWEFGGLYTYDADGTAPIVSVVSDNASDTEVIQVEGLDINGDPVKQLVTLTGTTRVALTTPLWRCFRMVNKGSNLLIGNVYTYVGTSSVPDNADVRALIDSSNGQTLMALYTVPNKKVAFLHKKEFGVELEGNTGALAEYAHVHYEVREYGKTFLVKKAITNMVGGSAIYQDDKIFPNAIPGLSDVKLKIQTVSQSMGMWGAFELLLIDEELFPESYLQAIGQPGY